MSSGNDGNEGANAFDLNRRMTRRKALSTAGKAAIGVVGVVIVGGVAYYVLSSGQTVPATSTTTTAPSTTTSAATSTSTSTTTATATTTVTATPTTATTTVTATPTTTTTSESTVPPAQDPIYFVEWIGAVYPDLFKRFNTDYSENAQLVTLPGDWDVVMESRFVSGAAADVVQFQGGQGSRWRGAGWLMDLNQIPETADYKKDVFPKVAEGSTMSDGSYIGYNYYIDPYILLRNEKVLAQGGYGGTASESDYPKTWDDILKQCKDLKAKGISDEPFLPTFLNTVYGFPWQFITDCGAEGEQIVDKNFDATFDTNTPFADVLTRYKTFWDAGLIPKGSLTFSLTDLNAAWNSGKHAFASWLAYEVSTYNDPKISQIAGYTNLNPTYPGKTGEYKLVSLSWAGISTAGPGQPGSRAKPRTKYKQQRIVNLLTTVGWKYPVPASGGQYPNLVPGTEYAEAKGFFDAFLLGNPFPAFYQQPTVRDAIKAKMATQVTGVADKAVDWWIGAMNNATVVQGFKAVWWAQWEAQLRDGLGDLLQGNKTVQQWTTDLRTSWDTLKKQYS